MAIGKLLVLGATSPTGKLIVKRARELGWKVTVYGRRTLPEHAEDSSIKVGLEQYVVEADGFPESCLLQTVQGQLDDEDILRTAIAGQDVIISVLGPSSPRADADVFVPAYRLILQTMRRVGVKRIIALSTYSVVDARDKPNLLRWLLSTGLWMMARKLWKTIVDIAALFDAEGGDIDWTLFRVGFLGDGPCMRVVEGYVGDGTVGMYVRRADVAEWTLAQAGRDTPGFVREKPGISSVKA